LREQHDNANIVYSSASKGRFKTFIKYKVNLNIDVEGHVKSIPNRIDLDKFECADRYIDYGYKRMYLAKGEMHNSAEVRNVQLAAHFLLLLFQVPPSRQIESTHCHPAQRHNRSKRNRPQHDHFRTFGEALFKTQIDCSDSKRITLFKRANLNISNSFAEPASSANAEVSEYETCHSCRTVLHQCDKPPVCSP
jgi:hypothetical protein